MNQQYAVYKAVTGIVAAFIFLGIYFHKLPVNFSPSHPVFPTASSIATPVAKSAPPSIYDSWRITKKPFGIYVSPGHSPVNPERFTGYHTGTDFETTTAEADSTVAVPAFCDGKLLLKEYASGYGGVAVESCTLGGQAVTVIYGHLNVASIAPHVGQQLAEGDVIGDLGKGYSSETDGERKHLHLGIHKGTSINILGYVQKQTDLSSWLDARLYLPR